MSLHLPLQAEAYEPELSSSAALGRAPQTLRGQIRRGQHWDRLLEPGQVLVLVGIGGGRLVVVRRVGFAVFSKSCEIFNSVP